MSYSEFPHTNYHDSDMHEMIHLYKELVSKYDGTLESINRLNDRLTAWEQSGTETLNTMVNNVKTTLQNDINTRLDAMEREYNASVKRVENTIDSKVLEVKRSLESEISAFEKDITSRFNAFTTKSETDFRAFTTKSETDFRTFTNETNNKIRDEFNEINTTLQAAEIEIRRDVSSTVEQAITKSEASTNLLLELINTRIDELAKWTDENTEYVNKYVYTIFGMSCEDWYDYPELTCSIWNDVNLSCIQFYVNGYVLTGYANQKLLLLSPLDGDMHTLEEIVIAFIEQMNVNAITAGEYDAMKLRAEEYDYQLLPAVKYDWKGVYNVFRND